MSHFTAGLTIAEAWQRSVRLNKNKTALIFQEREWSFITLDLAAKRVAEEFNRCGLRKGDRLAVYGKNSDAYFITFLGCIYSGIIHVPVNYNLKGQELAYILEQSGATGLIYEPKLAQNVASIHEILRSPLQVEGLFFGKCHGVESNFNILDIATSDTLPEFALPELQEQDCVQIMYTSGTTSLPKGAVMTNFCLMTQYVSAIIGFDIKSSDSVLAALPLYHTAQMHAFTVPSCLMGAPTILLESPVPEVCLQLIERHKLTAFFAPPTVWISLLDQEGFKNYDLSSLKKIYYGAAAMPVAVVEQLKQHLPGAGLYNGYGQTEMSPLATVLLPHEHKDRPASAGKPAFFVETRVVDEEMRDVPAGVEGEIVHRSPHVMNGYWENAQATEEAFSEDWYHSGDVGKFDEEGYLYIVDRIKDVINSGGVLVASREVEEVLYKHESVLEVAVISTPHEKWIEAVTAVVVLKDGANLDEGGLISFAKDHLASFKVPKSVIFVESLPKNPSGKVLKRELRDSLC